MTRIGRLFDCLKRDRRKGLIAYITAGDPSPERTPAIVEALIRGGADLIELGVPFSDPIADGPVIQRGGERALKAGTSLRVVLEIAEQIRGRSETRSPRSWRLRRKRTVRATAPRRRGGRRERKGESWALWSPG